MDTVFIYTQKEEEGLGSATFCFKFCPSPSGAKVHKKRDLAPMPPQKEPWLRKPVIKSAGRSCLDPVCPKCPPAPRQDCRPSEPWSRQKTCTGSVKQLVLIRRKKDLKGEHNRTFLIICI